MASAEPSASTIVYRDGEYLPLGQAQVGLLTHALHYGTGVFDGIRGYWDGARCEVLMLRPGDHYDRWRRNAAILHIAIPQTPAELVEITAELIRRNHFTTDVYVRPLAWRSAQRVGVHGDDRYSIALIVVPFGVYLESAQGLHAGVASWRRVEDNAIPSRGKFTGAYLNSVLATEDVHRAGFDEAIFLSENGHVAEGATCNILMVRKGRLITPAPSDNILEGITRDCVMQLAARELGIEVTERSIDRSELYICDERFFTGTAVELAPVTRVDHRAVGEGCVGPITARLRQLYFDAARGRLSEYEPWVHRVAVGAPAAV
jgi:branched-chain amino acid aminotransferase